MMMRDRRYTISPEWCGYETPRFVVRFCGDFIASADSRPEADRIALDHRNSWLRGAGLAEVTTNEWRPT